MRSEEEIRDVVDADCNFLDGIGRCMYQPRGTYEDCGNYGASDCPKKHPENFTPNKRFDGQGVLNDKGENP